MKIIFVRTVFSTFRTISSNCRQAFLQLQHSELMAGWVDPQVKSRYLWTLACSVGSDHQSFMIWSLTHLFLSQRPSHSIWQRNVLSSRPLWSGQSWWGVPSHCSNAQCHPKCKLFYAIFICLVINTNTSHLTLANVHANSTYMQGRPRWQVHYWKSESGQLYNGVTTCRSWGHRHALFRGRCVGWRCSVLAS